MQKNDVARVYDTVLSTPGMNEKLKLSLQITPKNILLLHKIIERGLMGKEADDKSINILDILSADAQQELKELAAELIHKAGLTDMNEKLRSF